MEKKIMNKIDTAVAIINKKVDEDIQRLGTLYDEVFTKEIRDMLDVIPMAKYGYRIADDMYLWFDGNHCIHVQDRDCVDTSFSLNSHISANYNDAGIRLIERMTDRLARQERYLDKIYETADIVIDDIVTRYRKETEEQENRLNTVLDALDVAVKPVKRIKVTIEWI